MITLENNYWIQPQYKPYGACTWTHDVEGGSYAICSGCGVQHFTIKRILTERRNLQREREQTLRSTRPREILSLYPNASADFFK